MAAPESSASCVVLSQQMPALWCLPDGYRTEWSRSGAEKVERFITSPGDYSHAEVSAHGLVLMGGGGSTVVDGVSF